MGSVELLTREGEIRIAKADRDGLKHMIQAISPVRRPSPDPRSVRQVGRDEMRIDELCDGLIDPNAKDETHQSSPTRRARGGGGDRRRGRKRGALGEPAAG